jgi:acyl-CoA thioesterase
MSKDEKQNTKENTLQALTDSLAVEPIATFLNMHADEIKPGYAKVSMPMRSEYLNFTGSIFGGIIMSIADQAFGYAANSLAYPTVASQFNIYFLNASVASDTLIAECSVVKNGKRMGLSEITVTNQDNNIIGITIPIPKANKS